MAVYYKFKSAKDYDSIPIDGHFISVINLKEKIFESKHLGKGTDFDLVVTNAQTNEEYLDEDMLIPKNTSVLIRRVPGRPRMPIVAQPDVPKEEVAHEDPEPVKSSFMGPDPAAMKYSEDSEWDEFGTDLYAIPEVVPMQPSNPVMDAPPPSKADEDSKIKALIDTPALDWQRQGPDGGGRGFGRGSGGRGRGFGRGVMERKTPPQGYICHRCKVPGHFIQHCPTNGDPNYDVKRVKPPTGIPKSMLMATPDGSYALPSGAVAVLKPNEAAFEKEIEGLPSTRSVGDLPPELHCPLCKQVMKDAVLTSKCCFNSFCDKCIRDHIISKSMCVCGATNVLADDLLPNKTLRDTINRILESNNSSAENAGSTFQVQDMESARCPQPKPASPNMSAASMGENAASLGKQPPHPNDQETSAIKDVTDEVKATSAPQQINERGKVTKAVDASEATLESISVKEPASQSSAPLVEEEVHQKVSADAGKKKKKKKMRLPMNAVDMQWRTPQDLATENFMMPLGPSAYNPYWNGMQPGMEGFMAPYGGGPMPYMMNGGVDPVMPFPGFVPPDPFAAQGFMMHGVPPQRDLSMLGMHLNAAPPIMSREEFEARKADLRRKRENERRDFERRGEIRELPKDHREFGREMSSSGGDISSVKSKSRSIPPPPPPTSDHHRPRRSDRFSPDRSKRDSEPPRPLKRKASDEDDGHRDHRRHHHRDHHQRPESSSSKPSPAAAPTEAPAAAKPSSSAAAAADRKQKASVFSRISFPEEEVSRKRKASSDAESAAAARGLPNGYHDDRKSPKAAVTAAPVTTLGRKGSAEYESSDDDRHFKRKPARYEPSPPPSLPDLEEEGQGGKHSSKGSRKRERREADGDRGGHSKHR